MDDKQRHIADSALRLFIQKGTEPTSLQDVFESANISKGTFYNYFSSKDELILGIIRETYAKIRQEVEEVLFGKLVSDPAIFKKQLETYLTQIHVYNLYDLMRSIRQGQNPELRKLIFIEEQKDIEWMAKRLIETKGEDVRVYSYEAMTLYYGMLQTIMISYKVQQKPIEFNRVIQLTFRYLELIVSEMKESKQTLFSHQDDERMSKQPIITELKEIQLKASTNDKVLIEGLTEELEKKEVRMQIIHALNTSLSPDLEEIKEKVNQYMTNFSSHNNPLFY
jgi:AcrR family transcriptional regulator